MKAPLVALLLGAVAVVPAPLDRGARGTSTPLDLDREIFFAVLEGLYVDGVSSEAVDALLAAEDGQPLHFVPGCPICMPAVDALRVYRARVPFSSKKELRDTFGPGLSEAETAALASSDRRERLATIGGLVERWIARRLEAGRPTPEERAAWEADLRFRREQGMAMLQGAQRNARALGQDSPALELERCAFCDGANAACGN